MNQWYKPSRKEWERIANLPYHLQNGKKIHYEPYMEYMLDGTDFTVESWEVGE